MLLRLTVFVAFATALMTSNAHAYIDPGTGSVVTTAIIGFFAAASYTLRKYFYRLKDLLSSRNRNKASSDGRGN